MKKSGIVGSYEIGSRDVPKWCKKKIMPYRKDDGSTGFEYYSETRCFEVSVGDVLVWDGRRTKLIRKKVLDVGVC